MVNRNDGQVIDDCRDRRQSPGGQHDPGEAINADQQIDRVGSCRHQIEQAKSSSPACFFKPGEGENSVGSQIFWNDPNHDQRIEKNDDPETEPKHRQRQQRNGLMKKRVPRIDQFRERDQNIIP